jgi:hypothetical protein
MKVASILLVAGETASGVVLVSRMAASSIEPPIQKEDQDRPSTAMPVNEVKSGKFKVSVIGPGSIEAARSMNMISEVDGITTILSILPEGTHVKKGVLVCDLDSVSFRNQLGGP